MYYVYKYVLLGEIIYVGITKDLASRIDNQHATKYDNITVDALDELKKSDVYYVKCESLKEADFVESELITKYQPKYNIRKKEDAFSGFSIYLDWLLYEVHTINESVIKDYCNKCHIKSDEEVINPKSFQEVIDDYRSGVKVDYVSKSFNINGDLVCLKRIFTNLNGCLRFEFWQNNTTGAKGIIYHNPDEKEMCKSIYDKMRVWQNRGDNLYYSQ